MQRAERCYRITNEKERLRDARAVVWDLDNTLYRFSEAFKHACNIAAARAALAAGVDLTFEEAVAFGWRSYEKTGHSVALFLEEYRLSHVDMHYHFHDHIDESLIEICHDTMRLFTETPVTHALVTHGSRSWAGRVLGRLGLTEFFPAERIIAAEDVDFLKKSESRRPFEKVLQKLGERPERTIFVEDMHVNTKIPHEMGFYTVLVHHGQPPDPVPNYIGTCRENARILLEDIKAYKASG